MASDTVSIVAAVLGGFILLYGLTSLVIKERLYISEACKSYLLFLIMRLIFISRCYSLWYHIWSIMRKIYRRQSMGK